MSTEEEYKELSEKLRYGLELAEQRLIEETARRRDLQNKYNQEHHIAPRSIRKKVQDIIEISSPVPTDSKKKLRTKGEREAEIIRLTKQMKAAAKMLEFEFAAQLRDQIQELQKIK